MAINADFWAGRRVLVTGHTGFKGAWLSLWLQALGADVSGVAPGAPTSPSLYELAAIGGHMREHAADVRDAGALREALRASRAEIVFHLAAQPMVRRSLVEPAMTYEVNVMGTVNLLEAVRSAGEQVRAVVVVTSDKCYEQTREDRGAPFAEGDRLGGADPYSSSKACAELVAEAYRRSYFSATDGANAPAARIASARAGNVIGGGDWGEDRLLADAARAVESAQPLRIRNPSAVRPWQHVLNPLSGYLRLAEALHADSSAARAWNFGPPPSESREVRWVVDRLSQLWRGAFEWEPDERPHPAEAAHLQIDSQAAERQLGWRPAWDLERALESFVQWHDAHRSGAEMRAMSLDQIQSFDESL